MRDVHSTGRMPGSIGKYRSASLADHADNADSNRAWKGRALLLTIPDGVALRASVD